MALSKQQAEEIKGQLLKQVENLPEENREQLKNHIISLNEEGVEEFLKQNNIKRQESQENIPEKPVFQSIIEGDIPSYKLNENKKAIAILELNPLSQGHVIILPKEKTTVEKLPKPVLDLAQKLAKKIKIKLKPIDIKIETSSFQDYAFINVIPIYKDKPLEKTKAEEKDLEKLKSRLETKKRNKRDPNNTKKSKNSQNINEISFRIP